MDKFLYGLAAGVIIMGIYCNITKYNVREDDDEVLALIPINPDNCSTGFDARDYIKKNHVLDIEDLIINYYVYCR